MAADWIAAKARNSFDPDRIRVALESFLGAWPPDFPPLREVIEHFPAGEQALLDLLAASSISCEKIARDPGALLWLAQPEICNSERGASRMRAGLERLKKSDAFDPSFRALRIAKGREMLRIALREIAGLSTLEQTTLELTHLAEVCLAVVHRGWHADCCRRWGAPAAEFAVLGMGKFGGQELNYSSDIDVIFLYGGDGALNSRFTYHEFFTRLAEKIVATFSAADPAGALFRIDLRLRPEGASGHLVRSLESMENYYAGYGETWERMALIKARGVCGDEALAYEFCQRLQPFIYPRALSSDVLDEISAIKGRIEREIVGRENLTRNVKLGRGGIREIEFVAQTLQLLHGAKHAFLQERNTLKTLRALEQLGFMPREDVGALADACRFLRSVEHRLQIEAEQQTHTIPEKSESVRQLAASLRFGSVEDFQNELARHTGAVRGIFDRVLQSKPAAAPRPADFSFFEQPEPAEKNFKELAGKNSPSPVPPRARRLFTKLEPLLVESLKGAADPDATLNRFVNFVERYGIRGLLYETLTVNPKLLELLTRLFDSSRFLTGIVLRRPQLIEEVARSGSLGEPLGVPDHLQGLRRNDEGLPWMDWVRVYRRGQILRIFLRDALSFANIGQVQSEYSALAEACLLHTRRALGIGEELTVVAMGKFGGCEASYGCDLDVIFLGGEPAQAAALIQAMTLSTDEGIVFPVDARLRPEGDAGTLTVSLPGYAAYFERRAQLWEAQALTKARPVCGAQQREFLEVAKVAWKRFGAMPDLFSQIKTMRRRVLRERGGDNDLLDFKTGAGGLMELEFLTQGLQMRHGIWENNTARAIEKIHAHGVFTGDLAERLCRNYFFLRRCEAVIRREQNSGISTLPSGEAEQNKLAKRLGFSSRADFFTGYENTRREIHEAFESHLGGAS